MHTWQLVAQGKLPAAHKGMVHAAKVMADTAVQLCLDPAHLAAAKAELVLHTDGRSYVSPIPPGVQAPPVRKAKHRQPNMGRSNVTMISYFPDRPGTHVAGGGRRFCRVPRGARADSASALRRIAQAGGRRNLSSRRRRAARRDETRIRFDRGAGVAIDARRPTAQFRRLRVVAACCG